MKLEIDRLKFDLESTTARGQLDRESFSEAKALLERELSDARAALHDELEAQRKYWEGWRASYEVTCP